MAIYIGRCLSLGINKCSIFAVYVNYYNIIGLYLVVISQNFITPAICFFYDFFRPSKSNNLVAIYVIERVLNSDNEYRTYLICLYSLKINGRFTDCPNLNGPDNNIYEILLNFHVLNSSVLVVLTFHEYNFMTYYTINCLNGFICCLLPCKHPCFPKPNTDSGKYVKFSIKI